MGIRRTDRELINDDPLHDVLPSIRALIDRGVALWGNKPVIGWRQGDTYQTLTWGEFHDRIMKVAVSLIQMGLRENPRVFIVSPNIPEMLIVEMAVMVAGGVAIPVFAGYKKHQLEVLYKVADASIVVVGGETQWEEACQLPAPFFILLRRLNIKGKKVVFIDELMDASLASSEKLLPENPPPDTVVLNMFTSGTTGLPRLVQLTAYNILSQQSALNYIWDIGPEDRFLSYLPWHHSFGGIFEIFNVLYRGATLYIESGYGKDARLLVENWSMVKPTVFFSVPKVHKVLVEHAQGDASFRRDLFHPELRIMFSAAAPLPQNISSIYEEHGVRLYEGWGLTETSPCLTVADRARGKEHGVVGFPIAWTSIRIGEDNEIEVKGPQVMPGYYKNPEANARVFTPDGWFRTGDTGEITEHGLKLISRKDRIIKLLNGEKVFCAEIEKVICDRCHFVMHAVVCGSGQERPIALVFPNMDIMGRQTCFPNCHNPISLDDFVECARKCFQDVMRGVEPPYSRPHRIIVIPEPLTIDEGLLTPSMKVVPSMVIKKYEGVIGACYRGEPLPPNYRIIEIKVR